MKIRNAFALLLAGSLLTAACGSDKTTTETTKPNSGSSTKTGKTLKVFRSESFDGWELDSAAAYGTYQTHPAVMEPLLRFSADGKSVEAGLADKWSYDETAMAWDFTLQAGVKFSNGTPVTSKDVVFSFGVWSKGVNFGSSFAAITGAKAIDDRTVRFQLAAPDDAVPSIVSGSVAGVMPDNFAGMTKDDYYKKPIGAGPYTVKTWTPGGRIELVRNTNYYAPNRPGFDEVVIDVVPDDNELKILFESGQADIVEYVSAVSAGQYDKAQTVVTPTSQVSHLSLNVTKGPLVDVKVRQAIAQALEYESIVKGPYAGIGSTPTGILAPNMGNWAKPSVPYHRTNVDAAKKQLAASKGAGGFDAELIYDAAISADKLDAQIVQANLAKIGIKVKLTGLETLAFLDRAFALDADMTLWSYGAISPDISDPLGWIAGTGMLFTGADDKEFTAQRTSYLTTRDAETKRKAIVAIQDDAIKQAAAIALAEYPTIHAVSSKLTGFAPAPWGLYYYDTVRPA